MSCPIHLSAFNSLSTEEVCKECGFKGWTPGDGKVYRIPKLENGKLVEAEEGNLDFLRNIISTPKRTRMSTICEAWDINVKSLNNRFVAIEKMCSIYGLKAIKLRDGFEIGKTHKDIVNDEPIIISSIKFSLELGNLKINDEPLLDNAEDVNDDAFDDYISDLKVLKSMFMERDISRNNKNSDGLKEEQWNAVSSVLKKPNSLSIIALPTGYGKTRIAQSITWCLRRKSKGMTLMISPLISLMDDQRSQFRQFSEDLRSKIGLDLHSDSPFKSVFLTTEEERDKLDLMTLVRNNEIDLFCCSPESLMTTSKDIMWLEVLCSMANKVSTIIIDEAHVIGDWGGSFRPDFQMLTWVKMRLKMANPDLRIVLMSATISSNEESELKDLFSDGFFVNDTIRVSETRKDLYFHVERHSDENFDLENVFQRLERERRNLTGSRLKNDSIGKNLSPMIIYTPIKKEANSTYLRLAKKYFTSASAYTGDTGSGQKESVRLAFKNNKIRCLVGTSAFGMGIDKPDVWMTSYIGMPFTLKGLYQAFGRAARKSNWGTENKSDWYNGVCFASIPERWPNKYKSPLGLPKMFERMYDMFLDRDTVYTENGYIIIPISKNIDSTHWKPILTNNEEKQNDEITDDTNDTSVIDRYLRDDFEKENQKKIRSDLMRRDKLYKDRMWVLSCLQRTKKFMFMGIHTKNLVTDRNTNQGIYLEDLVKLHGYSGVTEQLGNVNSSQYLEESIQKYAVIKLVCEIANWNDLCSIATEGYNILKNRFNKGRKELLDFLTEIRKGTCIRQLFYPTIGVTDESLKKTCIELNSSRDINKLAMPCSNCRTHYSLNPHENTSFLWSSKSLIDSISFTTTEKSTEIPQIKSIDWNKNLKRIRQNNKSYPVIENEEKILFDDLQNLNIPNGNYSIYKYKKPELIGDLTVNESKVTSLELNYEEEISWKKLIYSELDLVIILR
jgi:superfamily II DNA/RNA helicase